MRAEVEGARKKMKGGKRREKEGKEENRLVSPKMMNPLVERE